MQKSRVTGHGVNSDGTKITASIELAFRLRLAAPNDTICLLRALNYSERDCPALIEWGGFLFLFNLILNSGF